MGLGNPIPISGKVPKGGFVGVAFGHVRSADPYADRGRIVYKIHGRLFLW